MGGMILVLSGVVCGCDGPTTSSTRTTVDAITVSGLGRVLADSAGYALYAFLPDDKGPSRCLAGCDEQWPPLVLATGRRRPTAGPGVDGELLGTIRRPDGARQVTYNGWPLYTYISDAAGEVTGQGESMGAWYAVSTDGAIDRNLPTNGGS